MARSGHGGTVVKVTNPDGTTVNKVFHNTQWTVSKTAKLADVTDSSSQGWEKRKLIVKGGSFKFDFLFDDDNIPDTDITLDEGDEGEIRFNLGKSVPQKFYQFPAIVETVEIVNSQTDVIKGSVSGFVNGPITKAVTGSVAGATY